MKFAKLFDGAQLPIRKHSTDAGIDLYSLSHCTIPPNTQWVIQTGITCELPKNHFGFIHAKSKSNFLIGGGIVDQDYQGELLVKVVNYGNSALEIGAHQPIAQLLIIPCVLPEVEEVPLDEIHKVETQRGVTGGIVTGLVKQLVIEEAVHSANLDRGEYSTRYEGQNVSD